MSPKDDGRDRTGTGRPIRPVTIRPAAQSDAPALTALARSSKASWPYPKEWLDAWAAELTITPEYLARATVFVATVSEPFEGMEGHTSGEGEGTPPIGMIAVVVGEDGPEIEHLWVAPDSQGAGVGRALVEGARSLGVQHGWTSFRVESDPYAEPFYLTLGAERVGVVPAPVLGTERFLPLLALPVHPPPAARSTTL